jgi:transcriptional regulator with XRE-family HTH domain
MQLQHFIFDRRALLLNLFALADRYCTTLERFAAACGIDGTRLSAIMCMLVDASVDELNTLARAFGVDVQNDVAVLRLTAPNHSPS